MLNIETKGQFCDTVFGTGDIALVMELPVSGNSHSILNQSLAQWLQSQELLHRLGGIFVIYPDHLPSNKQNPPLKELRHGWERVLSEIEAFAPHVKRILLMC